MVISSDLLVENGDNATHLAHSLITGSATILPIEIVKSSHLFIKVELVTDFLWLLLLTLSCVFLKTRRQLRNLRHFEDGYPTNWSTTTLVSSQWHVSGHHILSKLLAMLCVDMTLLL